MSRVRILLDENVPVVVEAGLLRRGYGVDVLRVGRPDAPTKGSSDPELLNWCEEFDCVLVTLDRRTMPDHFAAHLSGGKHSPGVLLMTRELRLSMMIDDLELVINASAPEDWLDRLVTLPL